MRPTDRPDPERLLARFNLGERRRERGRLKIYFGAAPGVGKTYAMLESARRKSQAGADVVVGIVETHGRKDTEALLEGLEILPRKEVFHRGIRLTEFDLDGALARRPDLLLIDELAHTNATGSRHAKRWQDVLELLDSGIDVDSTLNVQHLDSLNDVVAQITGIVVRETVPDSVLDQAAEIELIDLPVEDLQRRLDSGNIYGSPQALRARNSFFRSGNLTALRELALRRTADSVDSQMRNYRRDHSIHPTWPVTERLIVSIGPSPFSAKLIRTAKRIAERFQAEWIVAYVETPEQAAAGSESQSRVHSSLRLAEQLGAEVVTLTGGNVADSLLAYARSRNVSRIVLGKRAGPLWKRLLAGSVLDDVIDRSGDIQVIAVSGEMEEPSAVRSPKAINGPLAWREAVGAFLVIATVTAVSIPLRDVLNPVNLVMLYLLGVVAVSVRFSWRTALLTCLLSVAAFDFFCVPPYLTFAVSDYEYLLTFTVMLSVAVLLTSLTSRVRLQAAHAAEREARTQALYRLTRELSGVTRSMDAADTAARITEEVFGSKVVVFLPDAERRISFRRRSSPRLAMPESEEAIAQWVYDHGQKAGKGMDTLPGASALYLPLIGSQTPLGVLAITPAESANLDSPDQIHLLELFAGQTALVIERAQISGAAQEAELRAETERMRSGLLSAVSHDLRTPLAAITGAASSLRTQFDQLDPATRADLIESIELDADRLGRLVTNLLEMTRLQSGAVTVKREWHPVEDLVGAAIIRLERALESRPITTAIPPGLMVSGDDVLLEQVLWNVLENTSRYTPAGSPISIHARSSPDLGDHGGVEIEIRDAGSGFAPGEEDLVWDRFFRGRASVSDSVRGAGLGLSICRAIVTAHGGQISAGNHPEGGALIRIRLPYPAPPPGEPIAEHP